MCRANRKCKRCHRMDDWGPSNQCPISSHRLNENDPDSGNPSQQSQRLLQLRTDGHDANSNQAAYEASQLRALRRKEFVLRSSFHHTISTEICSSFGRSMRKTGPIPAFLAKTGHWVFPHKGPQPSRSDSMKPQSTDLFPEGFIRFASFTSKDTYRKTFVLSIVGRTRQRASNDESEGTKGFPKTNATSGGPPPQLNGVFLTDLSSFQVPVGPVK